MRNDNNTTVIVKKERLSNATVTSNKSSRDSLKEKAIPKVIEDTEEDKARRSASVEIIASKPVEIDITHDDSDRSMPPPPLPPKQKRVRSKKNPENEEQPRFTRSKIKKEKPSMEKAHSSQELEASKSTTVRKSVSESILGQSKINTNETVTAEKNAETQKKGEKKKYPMPMLIKLEEPVKDKKDSLKKSDAADKTFNLPVNENAINNETITVAQAPTPFNETVTLEKNPHDSLMTEDNDEDDEGEPSMYVPLSHLTKQPAMPLKLKKNQVFK